MANRLDCGCEVGCAHCAEGVKLWIRMDKLWRDWRKGFTKYDWIRYRDAAIAMAMHFGRVENPERGRYMVWLDTGDDGYTYQDWSLQGRADSLEELTAVYQRALPLVGRGYAGTGEIVVVKQLDVEVVQELQIRISETVGGNVDQSEDNPE